MTHRWLETMLIEQGMLLVPRQRMLAMQPVSAISADSQSEMVLRQPQINMPQRAESCMQFPSGLFHC